MSSNRAGRIEISGLRCKDLPAIGYIKHLGAFYLSISINGEVKQTPASRRSKNPSWNDTLLFDIVNDGLLNVKVYAKRSVGEDDFVGELEEPVQVSVLVNSNRSIQQSLYKTGPNNQQLMQSGTVMFNLQLIPDESGDTRSEYDPSLRREKFSMRKQSNQTFISVAGGHRDQSGGAAPLRNSTDAWRPQIERGDRAFEAVDATSETSPYARLAWSVLSQSDRAVISRTGGNPSVQLLLEMVNRTYRLILILQTDVSTNAPARRRTVELLLQQTTECTLFMRDYASQDQDPVLAGNITLLGAICASYCETLRKLESDLLNGTSVVTEITAFPVCRKSDGSNLNDTSTSRCLDELHCARRQVLPDGCLPGTHQGVINEVIEWFARPIDSNQPRVFLLSGMAGCGKSAVARTVSDLFGAQRRCASFFFNAFKLAHEGPDVLFATISRQLADLHGNWKACLIRRLELEGSSAARRNQSMQAQFNELLRDPARQLNIFGPILIVIDALDESGSTKGREEILATLKRIVDLPPNFRFFITSRPEHDVINAFKYIPWVHHKQLDDLDAPSMEKDIARYVKSRLRNIPELDADLIESWTQDIVTRSGGLFQYATTACNYIQEAGVLGFDPMQRASDMLTSPHVGLNGLYTTILDRECNFEPGSPAHRGFQNIMGRMLLVREPMSMGDLSQPWYIEEDGNQALIVFYSLGSLLSGVSPEDYGKPVHPLHVSFADFLRSNKRSQKYHIDIDEENKRLADALFRIMEHLLRFNICDLETSSKRNSEIEDLETRIGENVPMHLEYACCHWADHLRRIWVASEWIGRVDEFLRFHLLFWLEVLGLTKKMSRGVKQLFVLEDWLIEQEGPQDLILFVRDATRFGTSFSQVAEESTPHLYLSALPFVPRSSLVSQVYLPRFPGCLRIHDDHKISWPRAASSNISVSSSADVSLSSSLLRGQSSDVGLRDRGSSISTTDSGSSRAAVKTFQRHSHPLHSVCFSPDGRYIVSGSVDRTVVIWDAQTGELVSGPLRGHTRAVRSVAFSPNGQFVVSGSEDYTVRMWNVHADESGSHVRGIFRGHTSSVSSVAFSPNGQRVVSGSFDRTVGIWDANTGRTVVGPLQSHNDLVKSVAFSPDGRHVASGSDDHNVIIWNADTGRVAAGPSEVHNRWVTAVGFSPDSKRVVTGSNDQTVRIWNITTGEMEGPFEGHRGQVTSVGFSSDGRRVVSGSDDGTLRIWDAKTGDTVVGPFQGHTELIRSVAFSPDGTQVISGSFDCTVRIWDANASEDVANSFQGHIGLLMKDGTSLDAGLSPSFDPAEQLLLRINEILLDDAPASHLDSGRWIVDTDGELLFWIPEQYRAGCHLWTPGMMSIMGADDILLDIYRFSYGVTWAECFDA